MNVRSLFSVLIIAAMIFTVFGAVIYFISVGGGIGPSIRACRLTDEPAHYFVLQNPDT
jgi:hypothetical protein